MTEEVPSFGFPVEAGAILAFAREKGVTLIMVGQSQHSWWRRRMRGSIVDRLARNPEGLDLLVVSRSSAADDA